MDSRERKRSSNTPILLPLFHPCSTGEHFLKKNIYLFGCVGSWLEHAGSSLHHVGSFTAVHRLAVACGLSCSMARGIKPESPALQGGFLSTGSSESI